MASRKYSEVSAVGLGFKNLLLAALFFNLGNLEKKNDNNKILPIGKGPVFKWKFLKDRLQITIC